MPALEPLFDVLMPGVLPPFHFRRLITREVAILLNCAKSTATGPDGMLLQFTFNASLCQASFPASWKRSHLVPLPKCTSPKSLSDIRPIALLPEISKLFERSVQDQLSAHLEHNRLLNPFQSGFRKGHSTQTALLYVTDYVRLVIDKRKLTLRIFFDFSKAFDTVPHGPLL